MDLDYTSGTIDGSTGTDTLNITQRTADLTVASMPQLRGFEAISMGANPLGVGNTLILGAAQVTAMSSTGNLTVSGSLGDDLLLTGTNWQRTTEVSGGITYNKLVNGSTILLVHPDINVSASLLLQGPSTTSADALTGTAYNDVFSPLAGNDTINGGAGSDTVDQLTNIENITGGSGDDTIIGSAGDNLLSGGDGKDSITAGDGNDTLIGGAGADTLLGGDGNDVLYLDAADDLIDGGTDTVASSSYTTVAGADGASDTLNGSSSNDQLSYSAAASGTSITVNLSGADYSGVAAGTSKASTFVDVLSGFEAVLGGGGSDILIGTDKAVLYIDGHKFVANSAAATTLRPQRGCIVDTKRVCRRHRVCSCYVQLNA